MILAVAGLLVWSFIGVDDEAEDKVCTGWNLTVEDSLSLGLVSQEEVMDIIKAKKIVFQGKKISDINMSYIERTLSESPYIDTVTCALTAAGKVQLTVVPKMPTLHVMADNGEEYYLDRRGDNMPIGKLTGNLCIATGKITKDFARKHLTELANCIQDSTFWRAQVQQIDVVGEHDVRLYTRIADHTILLGDPVDIPQKFWQLRAFYEKGLPKTGWDTYESISVEYTDIVIGKRRHYTEPKKAIMPIIPQPVDSTAATPATAAEDTAKKATAAAQPTATQTANPAAANTSKPATTPTTPTTTTKPATQSGNKQQ